MSNDQKYHIPKLTKDEVRFAVTHLCPGGDKMYLDVGEFYTSCLILESVYLRVPEDQIKSRIPYFFYRVAFDFHTSLEPYWWEDKNIVTPALLLELLGPITARAIVIAMVHIMQVEVYFEEDPNDQGPSRLNLIAAKWRFIANEMKLGSFSL